MNRLFCAAIVAIASVAAPTLAHAEGFDGVKCDDKAVIAAVEKDIKSMTWQDESGADSNVQSISILRAKTLSAKGDTLVCDITAEIGIAGQSVSVRGRYTAVDQGNGTVESDFETDN